MKTDKEELNLSYNNKEKYNEEYYKTHTYGLKDEYYRLMHCSDKLRLWKEFEQGRRFSFDKNVFIKGAPIPLRRGLTAMGLIMILMPFVIFILSLLGIVRSDVSEADAAYFRSLEKPPYSYEMACELRDSYTEPFEKYPLIQYENLVENDPELKKIREQYLEVLASDEYIEACIIAEQAKEYERAERMARRGRETFHPESLLFGLLAYVLFRVICAMIFDRLYLNKTRTNILAAVEESEGDESRVPGIIEKHYIRRQKELYENVMRLRKFRIVIYFLCLILKLVNIRNRFQ